MIPISSQSPTLPSHNSLNYELLSLTAICGEVPCAGSSRLTASESYRKKVVTSLTHDKLLRIFSSHHLRGYRLGVRTKRLLLQQEPERFAFYLSGCSDTNAIKSEVPRRIRLHRIAQTYVTMLNAGTMIYRDEKPPIFSPAASGPFHIEQPYFYDSREMKEAELEMLKIRGSRMAGALFTSNRVFAVYKEKQNTDLILSDTDAVREQVQGNLELDLLCRNMPEAAPVLKEISELIVEAVQNQNSTQRFGINIFPADLVRSRLMQLTSEHIRYVLESLQTHSTCIRNPKKYLLAMLFNAPITMSSKTMLNVRQFTNTPMLTYPRVTTQRHSQTS